MPKENSPLIWFILLSYLRPLVALGPGKVISRDECSPHSVVVTASGTARPGRQRNPVRPGRSTCAGFGGMIATIHFCRLLYMEEEDTSDIPWHWRLLEAGKLVFRVFFI